MSENNTYTHSVVQEAMRATLKDVIKPKNHYKMEEKPKYLRQVIRIDKEEKADEKPVEFTHVQNAERGWLETSLRPSDCLRIIYLGRCSYDGDMFVTYANNAIGIAKGHLNSGRY